MESFAFAHRQEADVADKAIADQLTRTVTAARLRRSPTGLTLASPGVHPTFFVRELAPMFDSRRKIQPQKAPGEIFPAADADTRRKPSLRQAALPATGRNRRYFGAKIECF
jgi:hypothetical protein